MIRAVIFDMDGLLIDSEPLWKKAELAVFEAFGLPVTYEMTKQTTGLRVDEVVAHWQQVFPLVQVDAATVARSINQMVIELIEKEGKPMPGVHDVITLCKQLHLPIAIASSSANTLIEAVIKKLGIGHHFEFVYSAEQETHGKPHPAVYLHAAEKMKVRPEECLAFEDSVNGVLSAKAAKMHCIAVPDPEAREDKRYGIADLVINSLEDVTSESIMSL